jgi:amino acid adenylation domain-containing protein
VRPIIENLDGVEACREGKSALSGALAKDAVRENGQSNAMIAENPALLVHRLFEAQVGERGEATAVIFGGKRLSYQELNRQANQLASFLTKGGAGGGRPIAVLLKPSLEMVAGLLGILKAGGMYLPLDPTDPIERIATILNDNPPQSLLTQSDLLAKIPRLQQTSVFCVDRDWDEVHSFSTENRDGTIDWDQAAYLVYTSGTTGRPKGVIASHRNLAHYILSAQSHYHFNKRDTFPAIARFAFSISLFELLSPLAAGGRLLVLEREEVLNFKRIVEVLSETTVIHASPSWWRKLLAYLLATNLDLSQFLHVRHISSGGDMVSADLLETMKRVFRNAEVFVIYGCTEVSCMACTYLAPRDQPCNKSWLGRPFENVSLRLCDSKQRCVADGEEGEIYIGGLGVTKGYLNLPKLTEEKFVDLEGQRFYRTGDLGRVKNGMLEMLGRIDFQIQLRGIRIEPGEVETHLRQAPGVKDAVVVARELGNSDKSLVAYIVLAEKGNEDVEAIRVFLQERLPQYMVPAAFVVIDAIPVNTNQKVDRRALPAPTSENLARSGSIVPPRDEWEKDLLQIFERTLGSQPLSAQSGFYELGGDSLQAIQILLEVEERWSKTLPITILLEAQSIRELAAVIRNFQPEDTVRRRSPGNDVVTLRRGGAKAPLFCLQGVWLYQELAQYVDNDQPVYGVFLQEEVELLKTRRYDSANSAFSSIPRVAARYLESIRSVRPHGPYYLTGFSFAGLIAFEMAQQLKAAGEDAALVALLDSAIVRKVALRRRLRGHWNFFREQGANYLVNRARHRLKGVLGRDKQPFGETTSRFGAIDQEDILDQVSAHAAETYSPRPYNGRLLLFRATDQLFFNEDSPDLGWGEYATGDFETYNLPGDHWSVLKGKSVSLLARYLQRCLG